MEKINSLLQLTHTKQGASEIWCVCVLRPCFQLCVDELRPIHRDQSICRLNRITADFPELWERGSPGHIIRKQHQQANLLLSVNS